MIDITRPFTGRAVPHFIEKAREKARAKAGQLLRLGEKAVILDTETTGLGSEAEIVDIAVIDLAGERLVDTLVKPRGRIPEEASEVHGIYAKHVEDAPGWPDIFFSVKQALREKVVLGYNASFDLRILLQTHEMWFPVRHMNIFDIRGKSCIMDLFASWWGNWNEYHKSFTWVKLDKATMATGGVTEGAHGALADCRMALHVLRYLAEKGDG